ncbi:MAG: phosphoglucomutase/phosphomannomutase PgmG [Alphaproteobacteria bacterium]
MNYTFDPGILREYDIRGQIGKNLSEEDAHALGLAFGTYIQEQGSPIGEHYTICVGCDGRLSSPSLEKSLCQGLKETGLRVINVGLGPTPMLYFSVKHLNADAGIMVTGSHNPSDYNGFKMTLNKAPVFGEEIQKIGRISSSGALKEGEGVIEDTDIRHAYVDRLIQDLDLNRKLTIAWDAGNGAAGEILELLTAKIPGTHHLLFEEIDGNFPNHHPDPTVDENLADLRALVAKEACDLGIAFDGDGDRIGVVDEKGEILRCDLLMTLYAREVLDTHPGAAIIGDVKCSQLMFDEINKMGGNAVMWKTGHSLIKDKMRELNAPLAGELSGHIFFADKYYGYDDALYCAVRLLNALSGAKGGLSSLTSHLPKLMNTPELRIEVDENEKFDLVPRILEELESAAADNDTITLDNTDGVRVSTPDGWWLVRPSNTQNVLVARMEANNAQGLERLKKMADEAFEKIGYSLSA